jgi:hypothetical protein
MATYFKRQLVGLDFLNSSVIKGLPAPTVGSQAANKAYVDSVIEGLNWKTAVRVAAGTNINLSSPGASIDGVTMVTGDRILLMGQTAPAKNGIYIYDAGGLVRAADANVAAELHQAVVNVLEGSFASNSYRQTNLVTTLDTDPISFEIFGSVAPQATETVSGIIELATQAEVNAGTDTTRAVTPATLAGTNIPRYFSAVIGDDVESVFNITHNLNNRYVLVNVIEFATGADVIAQVVRTGVDDLEVSFDAPPASASILVAIHG